MNLKYAFPCSICNDAYLYKICHAGLICYLHWRFSLDWSTVFGFFFFAVRKIIWSTKITIETETAIPGFHIWAANYETDMKFHTPFRLFCTYFLSNYNVKLWHDYYIHHRLVSKSSAISYLNFHFPCNLLRIIFIKLSLGNVTHG